MNLRVQFQSQASPSRDYWQFTARSAGTHEWLLVQWST